MDKILLIKKISAWGIQSIFVALIISMFVSCSQKVSFSNSTMVPGAEGQVKVKKDANNNYGVNVEVTNLTQPSRLPNPKDFYLVWMENKERDVTKLGQLKVSSSMFSKALKGSLHAISVTKPTRVFITAENDVAAQIPSNYVVLNSERLK
jgi:hypothetical protein